MDALSNVGGAELARIKRDIAALEEGIAASSGPRAKAPMSLSARRTIRAELQALIQKLDELSTRLAADR